MDMRRMCDLIEMELDQIADKGLSMNNLDMAYKLVDMYKDLKTVEGMDNYYDYDRGDSFGRYSKAKYDYRHSRSAGSKMEIMSNLERYMDDLTDKLNDMLRDADTQEERDTINRYIKKIHTM